MNFSCELKIVIKSQLSKAPNGIYKNSLVSWTSLMILLVLFKHFENLAQCVWPHLLG